MSTVIDPVTGLPVVNPGFVDQIPLGSQLVDWNGLKAGAQPTHQPYYPDDGYAVLSDLQAWQNGNPDAIQKLYTDNNHALWVYVVNSSGGSGSGPTPAPYALNNPYSAARAMLSGSNILDEFTPAPKYIYGWSASVQQDLSTLGANQFNSWEIGLSSDGNFMDLLLMTDSFGHFTAAPAGSASLTKNYDISLATPIDVEASWGAIGSLSLIFQTSISKSWAGGALKASNP